MNMCTMYYIHIPRECRVQLRLALQDSLSHHKSSSFREPYTLDKESSMSCEKRGGEKGEKGW